MYRDEGYTTPEGFWLYKPLALPDARSFDEVLTVVREWDFATMSARSGRVPRPDLVPPPVEVDGNEVGPFCSVDLRQVGGVRGKNLAVTPTPAAVAALTGRIVTSDDRLGWKVIAHAGSRRALIICEHSQIIGSHWIAYVDVATVPGYEPVPVPYAPALAEPAEDDPERCRWCRQRIYLTQTARGARPAHRDSKMLFCDDGTHRHEYGGQTLIHRHEREGAIPHGYFEHPEDPTPGPEHSLILTVDESRQPIVEAFCSRGDWNAGGEITEPVLAAWRDHRTSIDVAALAAGRSLR